MNKSKTIRYVHPVVGVVYIDKNTKAYELLQNKEINKLDTEIQTAYYLCYRTYEPVEKNNDTK